VSVWEEIKSRLRVDEVIGEYVPVVGSGSSYRCVCPFHKEKTPSLMISPDKNIWHCFGCGAGGDIFKFVMDIENITRFEALQKLAKKAGVALETRKPGVRVDPDSEEGKQIAVEANEFAQGLKLLDWTSSVYYQILQKILRDRQHPVTQYCLQRGLTPEIIETFKIGFAPKGSLIFELAKKHTLSLELLVQVGILREVENNSAKQFRDKFSDRLMIPVFNRQAEVVGFTGRVLPYDSSDRPRYLNSPQSQWFNKSDLWFGWHLARSEVMQQKKALIVEGNMDVIASFGAGLNFALASQGTSFTTSQIKTLKTLTKNVWLAFDNDEAGVIAGQKFFKQATTFGLEVFKVVIPSQFKDLDEYLAQLKQNLGLQENIANLILRELQVVGYLDWVLDSKRMGLASSQSSEQKKHILEVIELIAILDTLSQEQYLLKLSDLTKISVSTLRSLMVKTEDGLTEFAKDTTPEQDARPELGVYQTILTHWQSIASATGKKDQDIPSKDILKAAFYLIKNILPSLTEYQDLDDYTTKNTDELSLIYEQNVKQQTRDQLQASWETIMVFFDQNVSTFMLNHELQEAYLTVKRGR
jgi:DNA primase